MSKIGKKKILIPKEVNLSINGDTLDIKGPLGSKKINLDTKLFEVNVSKNNELSIKPKKKNDDIKKMWGMNRSLLNNTVIGVYKGFVKTLEMTGVGYKAAIKDNSLNLQLGYSHDTNFEKTIFRGENTWNDKIKLVRKKGIYEFYRSHR